MKKPLRILAAIGVLTVTPPAAPAFADNPLPALPIEEIREKVSDGNIDIQRAALTLVQAQRAVDSKTIEGIRLAVTGGFTYAIEEIDPEDQHSITGSASLTVPIIPQLQIGGQFNSEGKGTATVSINPFADPEVTYRETESLEKAAISKIYTEQSIFSQLESAYLSVLMSGRNSDLAQSALEIAEKDLMFTEEAYRLDAAAYDALFDAEQAVVTARQSYYTALKNGSSAEKKLSQLLGRAGAGLEIPDLDLDELLALTAARSDVLASMSAAGPVSQELENLDAEYRSLQGELADTPAFEPDVAISLGVDYPLTGISGSLSVSLSPSQFAVSERNDVLLAMELKEAEMDEARYALDVEIQIAQRGVEIAEEALASSLADLARKETSYRENEYLGSIGELTDLYVAQAKLSLELAQLSAYTSAADLYSSQNELAAHYW